MAAGERGRWEGENADWLGNAVLRSAWLLKCLPGCTRAAVHFTPTCLPITALTLHLCNPHLGAPCRRYSCNVCAMVNEVPVEYFCTLDAAGRRIDQAERPELCSGSVEYIAPAEYMVGFSAVDHTCDDWQR